MFSKLCVFIAVAAIAVAAVEETPSVIEKQQHYEKAGGSGGLRSSASSPAADEASERILQGNIFAKLSKEQKREWREARKFLKQDFEVTEEKVQDLEGGDEVTFKGKTFRLEGFKQLEYSDIYSADSRCFVNGNPRTCPFPTLLRNEDEDEIVSVVMSSGKIETATLMGKKNGEMASLERIGEDQLFVEVDDGDYNLDELGELRLENELSNRNRRLSLPKGEVAAATTVKAELEVQDTKRHLSTCTQYDIIEISIHYDSYFCYEWPDQQGQPSNYDQVLEWIAAFVSDASIKYEQPGLCKKLRLKAIYGFCTGQTSSDPLLNIIVRSKNKMCGGGRRPVLGAYRDFVIGDNSYPKGGDPEAPAAYHLLFGGDIDNGPDDCNQSNPWCPSCCGRYFQSNTIGCAYGPVLCRQNRYGVSWIYKQARPKMLNLFTHEVGHQSGASHDTGVMSPGIPNQEAFFSGTSVTQINRYISSAEASCVFPELAQPDHCTNQIQDGDETGVDCGGSCQDECPTCSDGVQNGDETGVDCGGPTCPPCPTCTDGIQNGDETGVDCGGSTCPACPSCTDGIQNQDETGVDCGGSCPDACPTCTDGLQNGDETGVDCGGSSCPACPEPTCNDGVQNQGEQGVDCGGPCPACPSCNDGLQNQGEQGVDCGGPCPACPTCDDGIQNGDETGEDCGGSSCPACPEPTCNDGVQNQGEQGIDCGGPCPPCPSCNDGLQNQGEEDVDCGGPCPACPTCNDGTQNGDESGVDCGGASCPACQSCLGWNADCNPQQPRCCPQYSCRRRGRNNRCR